MYGSQNPDSSIEIPKAKEVAGQLKIPSRCQIIKNLVVICIGFVMLFTAYNGLSMLQSTMNQNDGIGVASQAIIYGGFCISALLFPKYVIKKLGCKRTLLLSMSCYIPYVAANFYFNWMTMVPSAILLGLGASLLWSSNCTYFNESAESYSVLILRDSHDKKEQLNYDAANKNNYIDTKDELNFSNGENQEGTFKFKNLDCKTLQSLDSNNKRECKKFALCYNNDINDAKRVNFFEDSEKEEYCNNAKTNNINSEDSCSSYVGTNEFETYGNISEAEHSKCVSAVTARFFGFAGLLYRSSDIWSNLMSYYVLQDNSILDNLTENGNCSCGAYFCSLESNCFEHNLAEPNQQMRNILTGVSVLLAVLAVILVFLFLDELETDKQPTKFSFSLAMATCKFARKKEALLLLPLSAYIGLQQGFYIGDFTKSYIACAWGVYHVGLVTISYGIAAGISSTIAGILVKYVGRIPVMLTGGVINAGINIYLLIWNPLPDQPIRFFIAAAVWGIAVGILWSQLRAFYGVIFKNDMEAAFAGFYLWDSVGYCVSFSYSNYICTYIKIYILLVVSTLGVIGYVRTESIHMKQKKERN